MKTARAALLGAAILLCCLSGVYSRFSFVEQPQDEVIIRLGEEDILTCVVNDDGIAPPSLVKWVVIIDEADTEIYPGKSPFERYTYVDENHNSGNYNLQITNASPEDNAAFRCALDHGSAEEEYEYSTTAKVFVAVPPTLYYFMQNDTELEGNTSAVFVTTEPGLLTLFVADGNPAPVEVTWYRASAGAEELILLYDVITYSYENVEQHFFNTTSTVTVPQNGLNDEDIVRVEIAHPALDEAFVVNITADVQYGPSELIITPPSPAELDEGERAEVVCESDGNPQTTITWKKNQQVIAEGASLTFDLVQSSDAGNDYSCVAQNKYGVKSRQYQINVGATVSGAMIAGIIIAILAVFMVAAIVGYMYVNKMSCFAPAAKPIQPTTTAPAFETQASHPVKDEAWAAGTGQAYENKVEKDDEGFHTIDLDKAASETADPKALDDNTPSRSRESYAAAMSKPQPMPTPSATIAEDEMGESV